MHCTVFFSVKNSGRELILLSDSSSGLIHTWRFCTCKVQREHVVLFHRFPLLNFALICSFPLLLDFHMPEARPKLLNAASVLAWLSVHDPGWWYVETDPAVTEHQQLASKDVMFYPILSVKSIVWQGWWAVWREGHCCVSLTIWAASPSDPCDAELLQSQLVAIVSTAVKAA